MRADHPQDLGLAVLDLVAYPVVIADVEGRIVARNRAAQGLFKSSRAIADAARLRAAVTEACSAVSLKSVCLGNGNGSLERHPALVTPLVPSRRRGAAPPRCAALWFVPAHKPPLDSHSVSVLFGLSPAEARLACALLAGDKPAEYARSRRVKITTVRSQLHHIFVKTGTRRQSELIALLSKVPPVAVQE